MSILAFKKGLRSGYLRESLEAIRPLDMGEVRARAKYYIAIEVVRKRKRCSERHEAQEQTGVTNQDQHMLRRTKNHRDQTDHLDVVPNYTPLNTSCGKILREVYNTRLIQLPLSSPFVTGPDQSKCCQYHRASGHDTKAYYILMRHIKQLIQEGYFEQYVDRRAQASEEPWEPSHGAFTIKWRGGSIIVASNRVLNITRTIQQSLL